VPNRRAAQTRVIAVSVLAYCPQMPFFVNKATGEVRERNSSAPMDGFKLIPEEIAASSRGLIRKAQLSAAEMSVLFSHPSWKKPVAPRSSSTSPSKLERSSAARRAHAAASVVELFAWLGGALGMMAGLWILFAGRDLSGGLVILGSIWQTMTLVMLAAYIGSRTE
jgi:hypothetical protein